MNKQKKQQLNKHALELLQRYGFVCVGKKGSTMREWERAVPKFDAMFGVDLLILDSVSPWIAGAYFIPYPRPDLDWKAKENSRLYQKIKDAIDCNPHSGKRNWHGDNKVDIETLKHEMEVYLKVCIGVD